MPVFYKKKLENLLGIKLLNMFNKVSFNILVFSLISLFWKAISQDRNSSLNSFSICFFYNPTVSYKKMVVKICQNWAFHICYDGIYHKLIPQFQWLIACVWSKNQINAGCWNVCKMGWFINHLIITSSWCDIL